MTVIYKFLIFFLEREKKNRQNNKRVLSENDGYDY